MSAALVITLYKSPDYLPVRPPDNRRGRDAVTGAVRDLETEQKTHTQLALSHTHSSLSHTHTHTQQAPFPVLNTHGKPREATLSRKSGLGSEVF